MTTTAISQLKKVTILSAKYVSPSIRETAFNCAHCGALTTQYWYALYAKEANADDRLPMHIAQDDDRNIDFAHIENSEVRTHLAEVFKKLKDGFPFFEATESTVYNPFNVHNANISECFNCKKISIWLYDQLVYPLKGEAPPANPDIPEDIRRDYDEASAILLLSPRGAAALVRLCIQKLCKHLGRPGKNLNDDIGALVESGLDTRVQKALDIVRVIGNNAVHPGQLDLRDDRATAESLFRLLNVIAEKMISEPKHVDDVYNSLPTQAKKAIEIRDGKRLAAEQSTGESLEQA
jgi:Domain of unknown function (DUF4145)